MAPKKASDAASSRRAIVAASASEVSGPVATIPGDGSSVASWRTTVMRGCRVTRSCTPCANAARSTARAAPPGTRAASAADRKSTRLNSSHSQISYAVFCLKKKNSNQRLHNHSPLNFEKLKGNPDNIQKHLVDYNNHFSCHVRTLFEFYELDNYLERIREHT